MKEVVTLNRKEQWRLEVLNKVERGELAAGGAAVVLEVSLRHVRRMLAAYRRDGAEALVHGNRGHIPWNARSPADRERAVALARTKYAGCNQQHMSELLDEREELQISRSALRRVLLEAGIPTPRKRRPPKHRSRRERYAQEGMLLQIDGSLHDWLEGRGPALTLIGAIDDATGKVPHALFREHEDAQGYFLLLEHIVLREGRPLALYHDRHGIFEHSTQGRMTVAERVNGKRDPTQFGRMLEELAIGSIPAHSPQAKGRVERLWGTFQDRLVSELRLAGACTLAEANQVLWEFLPRYNQQFAVPAASSGVAYRPLDHRRLPEELFCFKYERMVAADNTVQLGEHRLQLLAGKDRISYAKARVEIQERMDGSLAVYYRGEKLASQPAPPEAPVLRARNGRLGVTKLPAREQGGKPLSWDEVEKRARAATIPTGQVHPWRRTFRQQTGQPSAEQSPSQPITTGGHKVNDGADRIAEPLR